MRREPERWRCSSRTALPERHAATIDRGELGADLLDGPAVKQPDTAGQSGRLDPRARGQDPHDAMDGLAELAGDHPGGD